MIAGFLTGTQPRKRLLCRDGPIEEVHLVAGRRHAAGPSGPADGTANHTEHFEFRQGGARHEDALRIRVRIGRRDGDASFAQLQKVVGDDAFENLAVAQVEADPQSIGLRASPESLALLRVGLVFKVAHERDGAYLVIGDDLKLSGTIEKLDTIGPQIRLRAHIAVDQAFVKAANADLLCC